MDNNKIETISNLFEDKEIRSVWDSEKEEYFFSVVDVISALTDSNIPRNYWSDLKRKLKSEGSELHENIVQLKMKAQDGKMRETDSLDTKGILKLISINDNIDGLNDEEDSYLLKGLLNIYNESYTRDISNKVKTALITKKINGEFVTSYAPYGYKKSRYEKNKIIIDTEAAKIVKMIFDSIEKGLSKKEIVDILNNRKIRTPMEHIKNTNYN